MIRICAVCQEIKPCLPTVNNGFACFNHYEDLVALEKQNREAYEPLVSKNELRELGIGDRRKEPRCKPTN